MLFVKKINLIPNFNCFCTDQDIIIKFWLAKLRSNIRKITTNTFDKLFKTTNKVKNYFFVRKLLW